VIRSGPIRKPDDPVPDRVPKRHSPSRRGAVGRREPGIADRLRALCARFIDGFEDHGDYFAEMDRSLPPHLRELREARRHRDRLALIASLGR
jgi:hypothetical protein